MTETRLPLYHSLAERLSLAIREGIYPVGAMLPSEAELRARFKLSRHTVREAIRMLQEAGMVSRHQGVGTRVERDRSTPRYVQTLVEVSDLWQYIQDTRRVTLTIRDVTPENARVELPGKQAWRMLEGIRHTEDGDLPVSWTQVYVHPHYADVLNETEANCIPVYLLIEQRHGVRARSLRQEITAVSIAADIAALLKVAPGSPGLAIVRHYLGENDEAFEATFSIHPGARYRYAMQLDLSCGAALSPLHQLNLRISQGTSAHLKGDD